MKQYITQKQWDELNDDQKNTLYYEIYPNMLNIGEMLKLNIGQMIEYLGDDFYGMKATRKEVFVQMNILEDCLAEKELCDALWEAVKYKLKTQI